MSGTEANVEPDLSGAVLGRYRLLSRLGSGGMGAVYLAQHELLDRRAAVKVLNHSLATQVVSRKRFLREARAASKVHHPGVVEIHDVAFAGDHVYFVMELLEGQDLAARLKRVPCMTWAQAAPILIQVADALDAAHRVGVIHRDVKPANCFLVAGEDGREKVKVVDFGIAKVATGDRSVTEELTTTGEIFGTVGYMPPEMGQGVSDDPRSDIYAMGVMMFRMLTGRLPFVGTPIQVISQHIGAAPPPPRSLEASIPAEVERIILRTLEKEPDDRQPSMRHLAAELREAARVSQAHSSPPPRALVRGKVRQSQVPTQPHPPITDADVIGLDQRPTARRASRVNDPWQQEHARTRAYGEEPPPPPMPGEPELPPELFRPPEDPSLELDLAEDTRPGNEPTRRGLTGGQRRAVGGLVAAAVVVALGALLWMVREPIVDAVPEDLDELKQEVGLGDEAAAEPVLLLIDTVPKDAKIFIDGVWTDERPIRVPRSEELVQVRVEAEGYEPRSIRVKPTITRRLEVKLDRKAKSKKKR